MKAGWLLAMLMLVPQVSEARVPDWLRKVGWSSDAEDRDERLSEARAEATRLAVRGAIKLRLSTVSADVQVIRGGDKQVQVSLQEADGARVTFREEGGDRVELLFNGVPMLRCGRVCVEVPAKSAVEVSSDSGDVLVRDVGGDVNARSTAGDVKIDRAAAVEARSVSGDVFIGEASGAVRVETVSGDVRLSTSGENGRVQVSSTSGDVDWTGGCGSGCRVETRTLSGDVALNVTAKSSFAVHFASHSGEVTDDLGLGFSGEHAPREASLRARYGSGDGLVEAQTFSGDLHLARAK
jgi:hypothetical protein